MVLRGGLVGIREGREFLMSGVGKGDDRELGAEVWMVLMNGKVREWEL